RAPLDEPLREGAGDPGRVGDPDGLAEPEPPDLARLADEREPVGGETAHPVDATLDPGRGERGHELHRPAPRLLEVRGREGQDGRPGRVRLRWIADVVGLDRHRPMAVGSDPEPGAVLPDVEVAIL